MAGPHLRRRGATSTSLAALTSSSSPPPPPTSSRASPKGRADDLVTALALCAHGPVLAAPAMHPRMWAHPAVARNVALLRADARVEGSSALTTARSPPASPAPAACSPRGSSPPRLWPRPPRRSRRPARLITAGPTVEDFDPVRYIGNRSTGKMGGALAEAAPPPAARTSR
ncbi:MAG: phosphopantothenoylcysteine decarboxylase [Polyangiaceae bacterium]